MQCNCFVVHLRFAIGPQCLPPKGAYCSCLLPAALVDPVGAMMPFCHVYISLGGGGAIRYINATNETTRAVFTSSEDEQQAN